MPYNFDTSLDRRQTESLKWNHYPAGVIPLWVADMDFVSPQPVIKALQERVAHGVFGYPGSVLDDPCALDELQQVIIERLWDRYKWQVNPEDLVFIPGVVTAFNLACHTVAKPKGNVIVETPVYPPFLGAARYAGMRKREVELSQNENGTYSVDWDAFEAAYDADTRLFILCNPHNPVGRVFQREELERMAQICLRQGVVICSDEIHCDLVYSGHQHIPIATLDPEIAQNSITLMAPSKTFNIAGLQFSVVIIPNKKLRVKYIRSKKGLVGWVNLMGLTAALAAYRDGQEWLEQLLVYLEDNRDFLYRFVQQELPGIRMPNPEGTYLAWLDCRRSGIEGNPCKFFLDHARVGLNDGSTFGKGGEGFIRLNFGCPKAVLEKALDQIKEAYFTCFFHKQAR